MRVEARSLALTRRLGGVDAHSSLRTTAPRQLLLLAGSQAMCRSSNPIREGPESKPGFCLLLLLGVAQKSFQLKTGGVSRGPSSLTAPSSSFSPQRLMLLEERESGAKGQAHLSAFLFPVGSWHFDPSRFCSLGDSLMPSYFFPSFSRYYWQVWCDTSSSALLKEEAPILLLLSH